MKLPETIYPFDVSIANIPACGCPPEPQFCDRCSGLGWVVQYLPADREKRSTEIVDAEFVDPFSEGQ